MIDTDGDLQALPMNVNDLLMAEENNFSGWDCWAGVQNITIDNKGDVWRAICRQGEKLGSIFTDFDVATETVTCQKKSCTCAADLHLSKAHPEHKHVLRAERVKKAEKSFCAVPWVQISTKPNGMFRACCLMSNMKEGSRGLLSDGRGRRLRAGQDSFEAALQSPEMKDLRRRMLNGERPEECLTCWNKEDLGLSSKRTVTNQAFRRQLSIEDAVDKTAADGGFTAPPAYFDLRFGNLCNIKCIMCHPASSSRWYDDYRTLNGTNHFYDGGEKIPLDGSSAVYDWHTSEKFWQELENNVDHIRQIYLVGGEPLLIERHYNFLELCVSRGVAHRITLEYDTNLTILKERTLELWQAFKKVILRVSIEDIGHRNEYIRFPSKWKHIEANLQKIRGLGPNIELSFSITWQLTNALTITDLWEYLGTSKSTRILSTPDFFDVAILPKHTKILVIERIQNYITRNPGAASKGCDSFISYLQKNMDKENPTLLKKAVVFLEKLDTIRGTNFRDTFPELAHHLFEENSRGAHV